MKSYELIQSIAITSDWIKNSKPIVTTASVRRYDGSHEIEIVITSDEGCPAVGKSMEKSLLKSLIKYYTEEAMALSHKITISVGCDSVLNEFIKAVGFELYESNDNNNVYVRI